MDTQNNFSFVLLMFFPISTILSHFLCVSILFSFFKVDQILDIGGTKKYAFICVISQIFQISTREIKKHLLAISYKILRVQRCMENTFSLEDTDASCTLSTWKGPVASQLPVFFYPTLCAEFTWSLSVIIYFTAQEDCKPFEHLLDWTPARF